MDVSSPNQNRSHSQVKHPTPRFTKKASVDARCSSGAEPPSTVGHPNSSAGPCGSSGPNSVNANISFIRTGALKWEHQLPDVSCGRSPWDQLLPCCSFWTHLSGCCPRNDRGDWQGSGFGKFQGGIHAWEVKPVGGGENGVQ